MQRIYRAPFRYDTKHLQGKTKHEKSNYDVRLLENNRVCYSNSTILVLVFLLSFGVV